MSDDTVDDLHAAEDFAGRAVAALAELLAIPLATGRANLSRLIDGTSSAKAVVAFWESYCRPTCGAEGDPDSEECDDDCGCPCGHADPADDREPPERELPGDEP